MSALIVVLAALTATVTPEEARRYNEAGVDINTGLVDLTLDQLPGWKEAAPLAEGPVTVRKWVAGTGAPRPPAFKLKLVALQSVTDVATAEIRLEGHAKGRIFRGRFMTRWQGRHLLDAQLLGGETVSGPGDLFAERAAKLGIDYHNATDARFLPPSSKLRFQIIRHAVGGASAADIDGDTFDDVLLVGGGPPKLFRNNGDGSFEDVTTAAGLDGQVQVNAGLFADFDNDGDADLVLARFYGQNQLYANDGAGHFNDVTAASGLGADDMTAVLSASDLDGDGNLDLYLGRFLDARKTIPEMIHYARNGAPNKLYLGGGNLTFTDISAQSGADDTGLTLGVTAADYDGDGDQDLYLANDFRRNVLLKNDGKARFTDVAKDAGALAVSAGMGADFGDFDNDGDLDLYVSSIRSNQRWFSTDVNIRGYILNVVQTERRARLQELFLDLRKHLGDRWDQLGQMALAGNHLLRNNGDGTFTNVSDKSLARPFGWYWSSGFFDVDNDGDLDVLAVNGWITGTDKHDL